MNDKTLKTIFSSESVEWQTPIALFQRLDDIYHFTLDPCASKDNAKCKKFFTVDDNGLEQDWSNDIVFCNPPYGKKETLEWAKKM